MEREDNINTRNRYLGKEKKSENPIENILMRLESIKISVQQNVGQKGMEQLNQDLNQAKEHYFFILHVERKDMFVLGALLMFI